MVFVSTVVSAYDRQTGVPCVVSSRPGLGRLRGTKELRCASATVLPISTQRVAAVEYIIQDGDDTKPEASEPRAWCHHRLV